VIEQFTKAWFANLHTMREKFTAEHPEDYKAIVRSVVEVLDGGMDPNRIHEIDDGDYQGTLVYLIGAAGYQPSKYWCVTVGYGSCSGCDTLQAIREYSDAPPNDPQVTQYMQLALHIVQGLQEVGE
jgi:hypothetical protein